MFSMSCRNLAAKDLGFLLLLIVVVLLAALAVLTPEALLVAPPMLPVFTVLDIFVAASSARAAELTPVMLVFCFVISCGTWLFPLGSGTLVEREFEAAAAAAALALWLVELLRGRVDPIVAAEVFWSCCCGLRFR